MITVPTNLGLHMMNTNATRTGQNLLLPREHLQYLKGFKKPRKCTVSDKLNLSVMAIVQSIRPLYRKFLGGGQSKRLNVLIMRVNVTVQGWKSLFKVILVTRARVA